MAQLIMTILQAILAPLGWFADMLYASGSFGIFLAIFAAGVVVRQFIRPLLGGGKD